MSLTSPIPRSSLLTQVHPFVQIHLPNPNLNEHTRSTTLPHLKNASPSHPNRPSPPPLPRNSTRLRPRPQPAPLPRPMPTPTTSLQLPASRKYNLSVSQRRQSRCRADGVRAGWWTGVSSGDCCAERGGHCGSVGLMSVNRYVAEINYRSVDYCYPGGFRQTIQPCNFPCCKALVSLIRYLEERMGARG